MACCDTPDLRREPPALGLPIMRCASCGEREIAEDINDDPDHEDRIMDMWEER